MKKLLTLLMLLAFVGGSKSLAASYTNETASIIWPFQDGKTLTPETLTPADAFLSTSVVYDSNLTLGNKTDVTFTKNGDNTKYTFNTLTSSSDVKNANLDFVITPMKGVTFKPTKVYFEAARLGHSDGKVTVTALYGDGSSKELKAQHEVARNNADYATYTTDDITISDGVASENSFTLRITIDRLNGKADGFRNIKIEGEVNGEPETVTTYTITAKANDDELGSVQGGGTYLENADVTLTATPNTGAKFVKWQKDDVDIEGDATIEVKATADATYTAVFKKLYKISFAAGEGADKGTTPNALQTVYEETSYTTPAANYFVAKSGHTATGWTDGTNNYAFNETITLTGDIELSPIFKENGASVADLHTDNVTITYNFARKSGAPVLNIENATGYYVQQATINGTTIDVPAAIDCVKSSTKEGVTGKVNNTSNDGQAQINNGTKITIPAVNGMTVKITSTSGNILAQDSSDGKTFATKVDGKAPTDGAGTKTATYTYTGSEETVDIVFGNDGSNYSSIVVTYPKNATYVDVTSAGYRTFASGSALDFTDGVEGLTAYRAVINGDNVSFVEIDGKVPAKEGMLIKAEEGGRYYIPLASGEPAEIENEFIGVTSETTVPSKGIYVLYDGDEGLGFYKTTAETFTVGANTAYLPAIVSAARTFISLDSETTGVNAVESIEATDGKFFDLQGRQVSKPTKGLYISNGKKYIVK